MRPIPPLPSRGWHALSPCRLQPPAWLSRAVSNICAELSVWWGLTEADTGWWGGEGGREEWEKKLRGRCVGCSSSLQSFPLTLCSFFRSCILMCRTLSAAERINEAAETSVRITYADDFAVWVHNVSRPYRSLEYRGESGERQNNLLNFFCCWLDSQVFAPALELSGGSSLWWVDAAGITVSLMSSAQRGIIKNFVCVCVCVCVCVSVSVSHWIASLSGKKMYSNNPQEQQESRPVSGFHREMTDGSLRPHQTTADGFVMINRGLTWRRGRQTNTTLLIPAGILSRHQRVKVQDRWGGSCMSCSRTVMKHKVYCSTYAAGFILSYHKSELRWID